MNLILISIQASSIQKLQNTNFGMQNTSKNRGFQNGQHPTLPMNLILISIQASSIQKLQNTNFGMQNISKNRGFQNGQHPTLPTGPKNGQHPTLPVTDFKDDMRREFCAVYRPVIRWWFAHVVCVPISIFSYLKKCLLHLIWLTFGKSLQSNSSRCLTSEVGRLKATRRWFTKDHVS